MRFDGNNNNNLVFNYRVLVLANKIFIVYLLHIFVRNSLMLKKNKSKLNIFYLTYNVTCEKSINF